MSKFLTASLLAFTLGLTLSVPADAEPGSGERLDRIGDRIDRRLDRRGSRIDQRLDRRADWAEAHGHDRAAGHLDRKGDRIERRLDRRGDVIDRRLDRRAR